jgi:N-acetyl-anhydromuramyl-L-alanine amidase AmpD
VVTRRAQTVWISLVITMTVVGGLLWALDTREGPRLSGRALPALVASTTPGSLEAIFSTRTPLDTDRWQAIVINHSGAPFGTAESLNAQARAAGLQGMGHHFVIGNGNGMDDGEVHVGYRWLHQTPGAHTAGPDGDRYNRHAVGICLVGNFDRQRPTQAQLRRLGELVRALQARLNIPAERVYLHRDLAPTTSPGRLFPASALRDELLRNP